MSATTVVLQGTVKADGTLELDGKVPLQPGKVTVTLQPVPYSQETDPFFVMLREIRAARERAGLQPRSREDIDAQVREIRDEFDEAVEEAGRLQEECQRRREAAARAEKEAEMIVCLDTNIVIYLIEADPLWIAKADARVAAVRAAGDTVAVCDATRLECLLKPLKAGDSVTEANYRAFFSDPLVRLLPVSHDTWEQAAQIGAAFNLKTLDSLHLATAVEHGCGLFLTADGRLGRCTAIPVEVLK